MHSCLHCTSPNHLKQVRLILSSMEATYSFYMCSFLIQLHNVCITYPSQYSQMHSFFSHVFPPKIVQIKHWQSYNHIRKCKIQFSWCFYDQKCFSILSFWPYYYDSMNHILLDPAITMMIDPRCKNGHSEVFRAINYALIQFAKVTP